MQSVIYLEFVHMIGIDLLTYFYNNYQIMYKTYTTSQNKLLNLQQSCYAQK